MYCENGSLFLLLKQCESPLLISNSAEHPIRLCSASFPAFCITILTFVSTVAWLQECLKSTFCVTMVRNSNFGNFSHIKQTSISHMMNKKAIHYLLSKQTCQQHCTNLFWGKYSLEEISPKKQCHLCHIFCHICHNLLLLCKILLSVSQKNQSEVQKHSTHYFLRLTIYRNQLKEVLNHVVNF